MLNTPNGRTFLLLSWLFLVLPSVSHAKIEAVIGPVNLKSNQNLAILPETEANEVLISRDQYLISYNRVTRSPNWVSWQLSEKSFGSAQRSNLFLQDSDLAQYLQQKTNGQEAPVDPDDYKNSCFDRGHQVPSADRTKSNIDNEATFFMSNMTPQTAFLNRTIWEQLESYSRLLVRNEQKTLFLMAGPIYDQDFGFIGPQRDIPVPSKNFKILFVLEKGQNSRDIDETTPYIAILMPNTLASGQAQVPYSRGCPSALADEQSPLRPDWRDYIVDIETIEELSQLAIRPNISKRKIFEDPVLRFR